MKMKKITCTSLLFGSCVITANATVVADIGGDYLTAAGYVAGMTAPTEAPTGWTYATSSAANGGTLNALAPQTTLGNGGNMGFGAASGIGDFNIGVLGGTTGGAEFEMIDDGFDGGGNSPIGNGGVVGTDLLVHPGNNDGTQFVIVSYTISAADIGFGTTATIAGSFRDEAGRPNRANPAGSITADIFLNSMSLFSEAGNTGQDPATPGYLFRADGAFNITDLTVAEGDVISFVVGNSGNAAGDESAITGTIDLVPEPSTALLGGFGLLALLRRRRA